MTREGWRLWQFRPLLPPPQTTDLLACIIDAWFGRKTETALASSLSHFTSEEGSSGGNDKLARNSPKILMECVENHVLPLVIR